MPHSTALDTVPPDTNTDPSNLDKAVAVRPGEELDLDRLASFLEKEVEGFAPPIQLKQFPGGYSNLTYQITFGGKDWILRRPPFGANIKSGHDMGREYRILAGLSPLYAIAPTPLLYCEDESVLGASFYIMEKIPGVILRTNMPADLQPSPDLMRGIATSFTETLADLHKIDYAKAGLENLGKPEGYIQRQISGWIKRYEKAKTDDIPDMHAVGKWLDAHQPDTTRASLIHNDFKYDNLVLNQTDWTNVIGLLDWEMATLGDPMMDLGTTLGYWVEPNDPPAMQALKLSPTTLPGNPTRAELAALYGEASGSSLDNLVFYYAYGLFKIAVIVQQIYARYKLGYSKDERFASLIHAVRACSQTAKQAIQLNRIDELYR